MAQTVYLGTGSELSGSNLGEFMTLQGWDCASRSEESRADGRCRVIGAHFSPSGRPFLSSESSLPFLKCSDSVEGGKWGARVS